MSALYHCMRSKDLVGYERSISSRSHSANDVLGGIRGGIWHSDNQRVKQVLM